MIYLNNEYDATSSEFIPQQSGVYAICTNVNFISNLAAGQQSIITVQIAVNGGTVGEVTDARTTSATQLISVCTIVQLQPGDVVTVLLFLI
ncbi:C1q-like domain-containing protein [Cytobacillus sp. IB215316]|uniref:C1q-like domain-containing protein n=1 Tax=Cytobacillus sp. IB215316 TaxID=3097354 RepID=UPI002A112CE2|nr:hypothetical protein [Cytobacillus sp. IB215316]MDX8361735.1 hypothetical protein [Cytobacillus sp. IB215316]